MFWRDMRTARSDQITKENVSGNIWAVLFTALLSVSRD